jgi:hypothetical protein
VGLVALFREEVLEVDVAGLVLIDDEDVESLLACHGNLLASM